MFLAGLTSQAAVKVLSGTSSGENTPRSTTYELSRFREPVEHYVTSRHYSGRRTADFKLRFISNAFVPPQLSDEKPQCCLATGFSSFENLCIERLPCSFDLVLKTVRGYVQVMG